MIKNVDKDKDSVNYTCEAVNMMGHASATTVPIVLGKLVISLTFNLMSPKRVVLCFEQDTLLSPCLSTPRSTKGFQRLVREPIKKMWETQWPNGRRVSALNSRSKGPGSSPGRVIVLCSWKDTLLSQFLSPPKSINGYQQTVKET